MSDAAESPCISICRLDDDGHYCVGCLRTLDEIRRWSRLDEAGRRVILERIRAEEGSVPTPDGGRSEASGP